MARKVLSTNNGKGVSTLGSKAGNVTGAFAGGRESTKRTNKIAVGKNKANAGEGKARGSLSISHKDGQRSGGNPKLGGKTRGPAGIKSKKGKLK